ncbi:MAG: flagellar basal body rod protein FlgB [Alphaproteobacteria bacterium]|nr:flagellar basal body rod protein FlgB [Alphaproteobacteria bacterium]
MLEGIGLFRGIMAKMNWLDQNQQVIAQNVANSDTPGYRPMSLKDGNFESYLGASLTAHKGAPKLNMAATESGHLGAAGAGPYRSPDETKQKKVYEASPDDNGVVLEEQLFKANENSMQYQIATDLYRRSAGMIRAVLQGSRG